MKKIAIKFHDNDFWNTFYGVLQHLHNAHKHYDHLPIDKEKLVYLINGLLPLCYITHQNSWEYNGMQNVVNPEQDKDFMHLKNSYLVIEKDDILVNEEVDEYVKNNSWNNSETFILDTTLFNNNIYSF